MNETRDLIEALAVLPKKDYTSHPFLEIVSWAVGLKGAYLLAIDRNEEYQPTVAMLNLPESVRGALGTLASGYTKDNRAATLMNVIFALGVDVLCAHYGMNANRERIRLLEALLEHRKNLAKNNPDHGGGAQRH